MTELPRGILNTCRCPLDKKKKRRKK